MADGPADDPKRGGDASGGAAGKGKVGAYSVSLFLVAAVLFLPPIVTLGEGPADLFGLPRVYVVLFSVWIGVVALIYLVAERIGRPDS
jgi:hypothetical protein